MENRRAAHPRSNEAVKGFVPIGDQHNVSEGIILEWVALGAVKVGQPVVRTVRWQSDL